MPPGDLRAISLHWTAYDYERFFPAYHFCLTGARDVIVHHTHDLRENMRDVRIDAGAPYAAHTRGRNSWSIGISIAAMQDATPADFGAYPITQAQREAMCVVAAALARFYRIVPEAVRTHAEAALDDGYFGAGSDDLRWDIARFAPSPEPLVPAEAIACGAWFRERVRALLG
ncbi:hypothetical protein WPS_10480 [Vulcanimicrobium alpinum]|uniref:N-acetylmuramoyl-L-alanine amidase domain-containing protein n=1 Tax=Vulcanimicrobium alpinum TaxID=3016050 RepID=A0AAN2C9M6_UNVUL|nr:N-acetylmuramoyl-L-alanine amidase [Vulcanimicrobium alpinum]BDE05772.1 hypothetical protein WPS_10480 [Vulcanimicrobium alpinum]